MLKPLTDNQIDEIAEFGAVISRHCRDCWTGEQTRPSIECEKLGHPFHKAGKQVLDFLRLIAWERVADLNQIRLGVPGQHAWREADWKKAICYRIEHGREARLPRQTEGWEVRPSEWQLEL